MYVCFLHLKCVCTCVCTCIKVYSSLLDVYIHIWYSEHCITNTTDSNILLLTRTYTHSHARTYTHIYMYGLLAAYDSVYMYVYGTEPTYTQTLAHNKSIKTHTPRYWISQNGHATFAAVGLINNNVFISASRDSRTTQDGTWGSRGFERQGSR